MPFPFQACFATGNCPTPAITSAHANNKYGEKYTRELLTEAVANSISIADVLRYLEIPWLEAPTPISAESSSGLASIRRISRG